MSKITGFSSIKFITASDNARYDDNQYFDTYAELVAYEPKYEDVTYIDRSTGDRYRWDGNAIILQSSGAGTVASVNKTGNTIPEIWNKFQGKGSASAPRNSPRKYTPK